MVKETTTIRVLAFTISLVYALHTMCAKRSPSLFVKANTVDSRYLDLAYLE